MYTIWKYELTLGDKTINVPIGARFLDVQMQHGKPLLWALVDSEAEKVDIDIRIVGTGHDATEIAGMPHVSTFQMGPLVWHVFADWL